MLTSVVDIFREIQKAGTSFSLARRICAEGKALLNGKKIDFVTEVDINEGDVFELVGEFNRRWTFMDGQWR